MPVWPSSPPRTARPDDLYKDGLNRALFFALLSDMLKARVWWCTELEVGNPIYPPATVWRSAQV